jgi:hypothetical protein
MKRKLRDGWSFAIRLAAFTTLVLGIVASARPARAAGTFKLKSTEVTEVSGAWHVFVTLELSRAPSMPHVPLKFLFTKTAVYERAYIDNHKEPVLNRMALSGQNPSVESLDVDFADGSGKIFKGTRFDFGLTRARGYEAGEYKVQVRTTDGVDIGTTANLILKGDNPVVDRRAISFNAKDPGIKKVDDGVNANMPPKQTNDDVPGSASQDVVATGTAAPFIPPEAFQKTPEEEIRERPKGCGCDVPGTTPSLPPLVLSVFAPFALVAFRRRRAS